MQSFLKELREASRLCADILVRKMLKDIADEIHSHVLSLNACPSHENLRLLNGAWVRGVNILDKATIVPDDPPRSGAGTIHKERLAA
jgi:hypothetical protein